MAPSQAVAGRWTYAYAGEAGSAPFPKQATAHRQLAKEILFGGAAGPGKTDWLLAHVLRPCWHYERFSALILRRTFKHLSQRRGIIDRLRERIPRSVGVYNQTEHLWTFRNGSSLQLGFLEHDGDVERYVGGEYGIIGWDQVEQFTEWQYLRLLHPLRLPEHHPAVMAGFIPHMACTANPGGTGHMWVKERWIDPAPTGIVWQPAPTEDEPHPGTRVFVAGTIDDNPAMPAWYLDQLEGIKDPDLRRALRFGDWNVMAGTRFGSLFNVRRHVVTPEAWPVPAGAGVHRACAVDYGLDHPWCALYGALFPDGLVVVYRELHQSGLTAREQADAMRTVERAAGERLPGRPMPTVMDPSMWQRDPNEASTAHGVKGAHVTTVKAAGGPPRGSIAWHYQQAGITPQKANNDRLTGTMLIADKLAVRADGRPRLLIHDTCRNLIKMLPAVMRDKANPELYAKQDGDDPVDTLRYLLQLLAPGDYTPPPGGHHDPSGSTGHMRAETAGLRDRALD